MKILSFICFGLLILSHLAGYVGFYSMGWLGTGWQYLNPLVLGPLIVLSFLGLIAAWIMSLVRRKNRIWTTVLLIGFPCLFVVLSPEAAPTVYGIRNRVMQTCTLDDLRHFARDVHENLPNISVTPWDTSEITEQNAGAYNKLQETYPFMKWGMGYTKGPTVIEGGGTVLVYWGGGFAGHWGFSIAIDGAKNEIPSGRGIRTLRVSDDIYFTYSDG